MIGDQRFIRFDGRQIWCGIVGADRGRPPLVCIPGGPGMPHDYLLPLAALSRDGRQVVFYDALGSGRSERRGSWTQEVYVGEVAAVCLGLGLERYHLFAHSAAALAVFPHALRRPPGLVSLVLSGTPANFAEHTEHLQALLVELGVAPEELASFETSDGSAKDTRYARIYSQFVARYMCRVRPLPEILLRAARTLNPDANIAMKGGRILYTTPLRRWDITDRLGEIAVPALFTCGRDELLRLEVCQGIQRRMPRCELAVFEHSGHLPHLDEPANYVARVAEFLRRHD